MVTCPLCRVTTSEKEIVDNLFLNPENSRNGEKDADKGKDQKPRIHKMLQIQDR